MSAKHRCKQCKHRPGPRRLGRIVTATGGEKRGTGGRPRTGEPKKPQCHCQCHEVLVV